MTIPRIGTAVCILKEGKVLLGLRKGPLAGGTWAFPGGHLEFLETLVDCIVRETNEETGLKIKNIRFWTFTEDFYIDQHYITFTYLADWDSGDPEAKEPHKCNGWQWFDWDELPSPLMPSIEEMVKQGLVPVL